MRKEAIHREALARLGTDEPALCAETVEAAALLSSDPPPGGRRGKGPALTPDEALDELLAPAAALIALGSDRGLRSVAVAVGLLTHPADSYRLETPETVAADVVLARTVRVLVTVALAWDRPEALLPLAALRHVGEGVLVTGVLRHLRAEDADAARSYDSHLAWWSESRWKATVSPIASTRRRAAAMAETELLLSCIAVTAGGSVYCATMGTEKREPETRFVARLRDPRQAPALAALVHCDEAKVVETCGESHSRLEFSSPRGPRRARPLVINLGT